LLVRIRDPRDGEAWREFAALYEPLIYEFTRKRGLQHADAADLTQIVLHAVTSAIHRLEYDSQRGSFHGWLFAVTRNQLRKFQARQQREPHGSGDSDMLDLLHEQAAPADEAALWEVEYKRQRFRWACERVRGEVEPASWQAFWRTAVDGCTAAEAARELSVSVGAVYTAKSRILERIRKQIQRLEEE
jgi:RNA polymerase sigma-70 factor (ECF subfamily)